MIDSHCHLEQKEFSDDLDKVILSSKKFGLKAVITSCAHPRDLDRTLQTASVYSGFVFPCLGLHPEFIKEIKEKEVEAYLEKIKENKNKMVAIGEVGLDFHLIKEAEWQKKQVEQFAELIRFSKEIKKPLVVHAWDAYPEVMKTLEDGDARQALLHMFPGKEFIKQVVNNNWLISINYLVTRSKLYKKIARDVPLENLCLETDAPWNGPQRPATEIKETDVIFKKSEDGKIITLRNDPTTIKMTAEKIAEIKKLPFETVWKACSENSMKFFGLPVTA